MSSILETIQPLVTGEQYAGVILEIGSSKTNLVRTWNGLRKLQLGYESGVGRKFAVRSYEATVRSLFPDGVGENKQGYEEIVVSDEHLNLLAVWCIAQVIRRTGLERQLIPDFGVRRGQLMIDVTKLTLANTYETLESFAPEDVDDFFRSQISFE